MALQTLLNIEAALDACELQLYREGQKPELMAMRRKLMAALDVALVAAYLTEHKGRRNIRKTDYALGGFLKCGHCGWSMTGKRHVYQAHVTPGYQCSQYVLAGSKTCNRNGSREDYLLPVITEQIAAIWQDADLGDRIDAAVQRRLKPKREDRQPLLRRQEELAATIAKGRSRLLTIPDELYDSLLTELQRAEQEHARVTAALAQADPAPLPIDAAAVCVEARRLQSELAKSLVGETPVAVRNALAGLIKRVELHFVHHQRAKYLRAEFSRGVVVLKVRA